MALTVTAEMPAFECGDINAHEDRQQPEEQALCQNLNIGKEVAAMRRMTVNELRTKYADVFGEETKARHKEWLVRRIAWRMQALAEGDISQRARQWAAELANDADLRTTAPKERVQTPARADSAKNDVLLVAADRRLPMPGQEIVREYKGQRYCIRVLADGFEFEGEVYKSLSAVAKKITGTHCNGYLFFRLNGQGCAK